MPGEGGGISPLIMPPGETFVWVAGGVIPEAGSRFIRFPEHDIISFEQGGFICQTFDAIDAGGES